MLHGSLALGHLCKLRRQHAHGDVSRHVSSLGGCKCKPTGTVAAKLQSHFFAPSLEVRSFVGDTHVRVNLQMYPSLVALGFYPLNTKLVKDYDRRFHIKRLCGGQNGRSGVAEFRDSVNSFGGGWTSLLRRDEAPGRDRFRHRRGCGRGGARNHLRVHRSLLRRLLLVCLLRFCTHFSCCHAASARGTVGTEWRRS